MKRLSVGIFIAVLTASSAASATTYYFSGDQCQANAADVYVHPYFGSYNISTTNARNVWCGSSGVAIASGGITSVVATVYDRHATSGQDVACTLSLFSSAGGTPTYQSTATTSSWSYSPMTLSWTGISATGANFATLYCVLPAATGYGASHIANFKVTN